MPLDRSPWDGERTGVFFLRRRTRSCGCGDGEEALEGATEAAFEVEPVCLVFRVVVFFFAIMKRDVSSGKGCEDGLKSGSRVGEERSKEVGMYLQFGWLFGRRSECRERKNSWLNDLKQLTKKTEKKRGYRKKKERKESGKTMRDREGEEEAERQSDQQADRQKQAEAGGREKENIHEKKNMSYFRPSGKKTQSKDKRKRRRREDKSQGWDVFVPSYLTLTHSFSPFPIHPTCNNHTTPLSVHCPLSTVHRHCSFSRFPIHTHQHFCTRNLHSQLAPVAQ